MKLIWLVDIDLMLNDEDNAEKSKSALAHLRGLGYPVMELSVTKNRPKFLKQYNEDPEIVLAFLGSFEELRSLQKEGIRVATYGLNQYINQSAYLSYLPNEWFLNHNVNHRQAQMTTWGILQKNPDRFFEQYADVDCYDRDLDTIFVRPDNGRKTFTGQVFQRHKMMEEMKFLESHSTVLPETVIWVGEAQNIDREYRFWISNGKVVTWSQYSWDKSAVLSPQDPNAETFKLAKTVAEYSWQLDRIYTVDIMESGDTIKIVEMNAFSTSGLYNCDVSLLLETVSRDILAEWEED